MTTPGVNTIYNTNVVIILFWSVNGMGTNFSYLGR
jgi:hypothetical protein